MYNFSDRKRKKLQDSEFPSLGKVGEHPMSWQNQNLDYSTVCKDGNDGVIHETITKKESIVLPKPPPKIMFPLKETYDWSAVPQHF